MQKRQSGLIHQNLQDLQERNVRPCCVLMQGRAQGLRRRALQDAEHDKVMLRSHCAVALAGRNSSEASVSRPCGACAASGVTSSRLMPKRVNGACSAELRVPWRPGACLRRAVFSMPPIEAPGTSIQISVEAGQHPPAPCGSRAMTFKNNGRRRHRAGGSGGDHRPQSGAPPAAGASASIRRSRRCAGSIFSRSRR